MTVKTKLFAVAVLVLALLSVAATGAHAQAVYSATVTSVTSGDAFTAQLADGQQVEVRLIGVDAPEAQAPAECGGAAARAALGALTLGQAVTLTADPTVDSLDGNGRSWLYADLADGRDAGLEMIQSGWAQTTDDVGFARRAAYIDAEPSAAEGLGVWAECGGDFHLTRAEEVRGVKASAKTFVRSYYRHLSARRFRAAWGLLGAPVKRKAGWDYRSWKSGYRSSLGIAASARRVRISGKRATVTVTLRSRDRDVCSGSQVVQRFRGTVRLAPRSGSWAIERFRIHKTAGAKPRTSKSQCPPPPEPPPVTPTPVTPTPQTPDCQGYSPCISPGSDVDCAGGSGNGPRYVDGPVYVNGSDPYDLDSDGDGVGCED